MLGGMTPLTPEQALAVLTTIELPTVAAEQKVTRSVIAAIPPDKADYTPDPVSAGQFDLTPRPRPDTVRTPADVIAWYDEQLAPTVARLKQVSGEDLVKPIDFRGILKFPALTFVRIGLNHSVHHRGQLSMYLRPMGAAVPSIYGESFDARKAREAQAAR
jgi:hypothetical protein